MNTSKLRALALAAHQGSWGYATIENGIVNPLGAALLVGLPRPYIDRTEAFTPQDAAYIAAANPATILSLLDRIDALEKVAEIAETHSCGHCPECRTSHAEDDSVYELRQALADLCKLNTPAPGSPQ